jgi:hypothetical protein
MHGIKIPMQAFFRRNIDNRGRIVRAVYGALMIALGMATLSGSAWVGGGLVALGVLGILEAVRGWCILRACGIRTRL